MTIQQAAAVIGISRQALYRRLKEQPELCSTDEKGKMFLTAEQVKTVNQIVNHVNQSVNNVDNTSHLASDIDNHVDTADRTDSFTKDDVNFSVNVNHDVNQQVDKPIKNNTTARAATQPTDKPLQDALLQLELQSIKQQHTALEGRYEALAKQLEATQKELDAARERELEHVAKIEKYADRFSELAMAAHIQKQIEAPAGQEAPTKRPGLLARLFNRK